MKTTNERTNEARGSRERGKGRRAGKEAEPVRAVREGKHEERRRNGRESEREKGRGGGEARAADVGTSVSVLRDVKGGIEVPLVPRG